MCSHRDLPMSERHVTVYIYKAILKDGEESTDQYIEMIAKQKDNLIQTFLEAMKEVAVDCELNKAHNMITGEYKCFKFDDYDTLMKPVPAAYKEDVYDDIKMDSGLNNTRSIIKRIRTLKVKAVKKLKSENKYSNSDTYWYDEKTGIIYDYEFKYVLGKVAMDENGLPEKLDKDTYIISELVNIPSISA